MKVFRPYYLIAFNLISFVSCYNFHFVIQLQLRRKFFILENFSSLWITKKNAIKSRSKFEFILKKFTLWKYGFFFCCYFFFLFLPFNTQLINVMKENYLLKLNRILKKISISSQTFRFFFQFSSFFVCCIFKLKNNISFILSSFFLPISIYIKVLLLYWFLLLLLFHFKRRFVNKLFIEWPLVLGQIHKHKKKKFLRNCMLKIYCWIHAKENF